MPSGGVLSTTLTICFQQQQNEKIMGLNELIILIIIEVIGHAHWRIRTCKLSCWPGADLIGSPWDWSDLHRTKISGCSTGPCSLHVQFLFDISQFWQLKHIYIYIERDLSETQFEIFVFISMQEKTCWDQPQQSSNIIWFTPLGLYSLIGKTSYCKIW